METKPERLQKILAAAGLASRRKAEELIAAGLVSVNGHIVTEPGSKADPRLDEIRVEGKLLRGPERHVYLAMYKPKGTMTTVSDPEGRPTVMDLLKGVDERVFPVGRLDYMSEGLLLLTNDGDLMAQLTRAGSHVAKTYMVKVSGKPTEEAIDKLRSGIMLPPEPGLTGARGKKQPGVERRSFAVRTQPAAIQLAVDQENPWFEVTLTEGRNRQLRRMFEQIGHHIEKIKRIRYGSLTLDLEPGEFRHLTPKEVNQLRRSLEVPFKPKPIKPKRKGVPSAGVTGGLRRSPARPELQGHKPLRDSARFVKGRRGKVPGEPVVHPESAQSGQIGAPVGREGAPSAPFGVKGWKPKRTAAGFPPSTSAPAFDLSSARRPLREGEERRPYRESAAPRGPEFARGQRPKGQPAERDERYGAKRPFASRPEPRSGSRIESRTDSRRGPAAGRTSTPARQKQASWGPGFAAGRRFAKGPGLPGKPGVGLRGRKPERGETGSAEELKRGKGFKRGGFERGELDRSGEGAGGRGARSGKGFDSRRVGAKPGRPGRGGFKPSSGGSFERIGGAGFKRPGLGREGLEREGSARPGFKREGSDRQGPKRPDFKRPGARGPSEGVRGKPNVGGRFGRPSGGAIGRPSSPRRGGSTPRPPRRPEQE